jgi:hypothetical protein
MLTTRKAQSLEAKAYWAARRKEKELAPDYSPSKIDATHPKFADLLA